MQISCALQLICRKKFPGNITSQSVQSHDLLYINIYSRFYLKLFITVLIFTVYNARIIRKLE